MRGNFMKKKMPLPESFIIDTTRRLSNLSLPLWHLSSGELRTRALAQAEIYKPRTSWKDRGRGGKRRRRMENLSPTSWQGRLTRRGSSKCQVHQGRAEQESQNEAWPLRAASLRKHSRMQILDIRPENGWERKKRTLHIASQAQSVGGPEDAGFRIETKSSSIMRRMAK